MKNLTKIVAIPLFFSVIGCTTLKDEIIREFPEGHIYGVEYNILNQKIAPYNLEEQVIYEERQYFNKRDENSTTLPMEIYLYNDVTRELDLDSGKITLQPKKRYVPRLDEGNYPKDKYTDWVLLENKGTYGIKADMSTVEELRKKDNIEGNKYGYKVISTEEGASFALRTTNILGEEYFFPHVENGEINKKGKLDYYLIPVKGAKIQINNKCGNITIYNENKIYRPIDPEIYPELFRETPIQTQNKFGN